MKNSNSVNKIWFAAAGGAAGIINGFFGAGGGMVLVPLLIGVAKLEDKKAFSYAIAIILPMCLVTIAVYWTQQIFPIEEALPYLLGGLLGGLLAMLATRDLKGI